MRMFFFCPHIAVAKLRPNSFGRGSFDWSQLSEFSAFLYHSSRQGSLELLPSSNEIAALSASRIQTQASVINSLAVYSFSPFLRFSYTRAASRMNDLFDRYLAEHAKPHKKASSIRQDETNLRAY